MDASDSEDLSALTLLSRFIKNGRSILSADNLTIGRLKMWSGGIRSHLNKIYSAGHPILEKMAPGAIKNNVDPRAELALRIQMLEQFVADVEQAGRKTFLNENLGSRVFIGHGRSPIWRELKDFLNERLSLPWDEFNREAVAGVSTSERITSMLDSACFAFLIMTAEDQHLDSTIHARQNVVHEVGLFQGRLGPRKAIILLEEGCEEFSNIIGLSQIRFPAGRISAVFEEIRRVLEREGII